MALEEAQHLASTGRGVSGVPIVFQQPLHGTAEGGRFVGDDDFGSVVLAQTADQVGDDFGFAVAAHPRAAGTAWFVPAVKDEMRLPRDGALIRTSSEYPTSEP